MRKFEIHITGAAGINLEFDTLGIKNIMVQLLKPNMTTIRTEFMSSFIREFETYEECYDYVQTLVAGLISKVIRIKIESPIYEDYIDRSVYIESHFKYDGSTPEFPISRNAFSGKIMGTDRTYIKSEYYSFIQKWQGYETELCLFDDYIREDFDWFNEYNDIKIEEPCHINTGITSLDQILSHGIPKGHITMLIGKCQYAK